MHINYDLVKVTDKDKVGIFLKLLTYCWSTWEKGVGVLREGVGVPWGEGGWSTLEKPSRTWFSMADNPAGPPCAMVLGLKGGREVMG